MIPETVRVRLAHPDITGTQVLGRGDNFADDSADLRQLDADVFFISMQRAFA